MLHIMTLTYLSSGSCTINCTPCFFHLPRSWLDPVTARHSPFSTWHLTLKVCCTTMLYVLLAWLLCYDWGPEAGMYKITARAALHMCCPARQISSELGSLLISYNMIANCNVCIHYLKTCVVWSQGTHPLIIDIDIGSTKESTFDG